jgi:hypothetical protein
MSVRGQSGDGRLAGTSGSHSPGSAMKVSRLPAGEKYDLREESSPLDRGRLIADATGKTCCMDDSKRSDHDVDDEERGRPGAEGGDSDAADDPPAAPADDSSPLDDTDQHSDADA